MGIQAEAGSEPPSARERWETPGPEEVGGRGSEAGAASRQQREAATWPGGREPREPEGTEAPKHEALE